MSREQHADAMEEIARIDFLLDELARAVERGEVHRASYDLMAPRYLERRADLVADVTGVAREKRPASLQKPGSPAVPALRQQAFDEYFTAPVKPATRPKPKPPKPVDWTTVLLFLGAFLVIVASAIFSVAVWGTLGTGAKLAFLGALTAGFYGAAWWARSRLQLAVGSIALAAVASAMLLFDGWMVIDGYGLSGPLPWAVLLLVCSVVYWYVEVLLAARFFGVVGAAAQVGWWWLLGEGMGMPAPTRIAGIAVVALLWQFAAERGRGRRAVDGLAAVLSWAAPVVAVGSAAAMFVSLAWVRGADVKTVGAAAVIAVAAGMTVWRSELVPRPARAPIAAALQVPLLVAAWTATAEPGGAWWVLAIFVAVALVSDVIAFGPGGVPFLLVGLIAELSAVIELCRLLNVSAPLTLVVIAGLAAVWALSSRLIRRMEPRLGPMESTPENLGRLSIVIEAAAWGALAFASLTLPIVTWSFPLPGSPLVTDDALAYLGVLAGWWAATVARPRGAAAVAGSMWAFVTLSAFTVSWVRDVSVQAWATSLVALAGVWLASAHTQRRLYGDLWGEITRWGARGLVYLLFVTGTAATLADFASAGPVVLGMDPRWHPVALALAVGAFCFADALISRCRASLAFAGAAVPVATYFAFEASLSTGYSDLQFAAVAVSALAVAIAALWLERQRLDGIAGYLPAAAMTVATLFALHLTEPDVWATVPWNTIAWVTIAVGWAAASATTTQEVSFAAGLALVPAAWSAVGDTPESAVVLASFSVCCLLLGAPSLFLVFRPGGRLAVSGAALALSGALVMIAPISAGELTGHHLSVAWLVLAVYAATLSALRDSEPVSYLAGLPLVLAAWTEVSLTRQPSPALFSTPLALYLVAVGHLYLWQGARRGLTRVYPFAIDVFVVLIGLGYPLLAALRATPDRSFVEALVVLALSLTAIVAGVVLKVRWYFFGGVAALAAIAFYRSFSAIAEYWWLVLGIVGVAMLAIALTWERQRMLVADTREKLRRSFEGWR